jgi:glycosyltransferase involved in cell wall biosynthesis
MKEVWFWQIMISPHMASLAEELSKIGYRVRYIVSKHMSDDRKKQGWISPDIPNVELILINDSVEALKIASQADKGVVHICQGFRGNGYVKYVQKYIYKNKLTNLVIIETIDFSGIKGFVKFIFYKIIININRDDINGVLAIGDKTKKIMIRLGIDEKKIYPFAYFLENKNIKINEIEEKYIFLYVGRMINLKRVDWFINALSKIEDENFEAWFVGDGESYHILKNISDIKLHNRSKWIGQLPMDQVRSIMQQADCLVLPSIHDGWGAVISEALMAGTPVICSDACGASGVVKASNNGGVFEKNDQSGLVNLLFSQIKLGKIDDVRRRSIKSWAYSLSAPEGARYLKSILDHDSNTQPPWF